jgi:indolepyruvate ferredoxin oxidoreductase beta subunit
MPEKDKVTNVVFAGLGGQGIIKASDMLAEAAFRSGFDVKKSEIHGMSQRGGSVTSDVRFGREVFSPMVPSGEAQFMVVLDSTQIEAAQHVMRPDGLIFKPEMFLKDGQTFDDLDKDPASPVNRRNLNVALLGALSTHLDLAENVWLEAVYANLPEKLHEQNAAVFAYGREVGKKA